MRIITKKYMPIIVGIFTQKVKKAFEFFANKMGKVENKDRILSEKLLVWIYNLAGSFH